jgi:hypothetical protein
MEIAYNLLCDDNIYILVKINDNETKLESLKYKMRFDKICAYKLLIYILKNYLKEYIIDYIELDRVICYFQGIREGSFYIQHNKYRKGEMSHQEYEEYFNKYDYNKLTSPLNKTIYDNILHKTVKEYEILYKKIMNSQKKIVRWYRHQTKIRKTRLLLTSYYHLNKRKLQLPTEIICNKILKINY